MEVWALYAYGAAHVLQEMMTIKSDDVVGRVKVYEALVKGAPIPKSGIPESFRVLIKEFQALGLDITVLNEAGNLVELKDLEESDKDGFGSNDEQTKDVVVNQVGSESNDEIFEEYNDEFEDDDYETDDFEFDNELDSDDEFEDAMDDDFEIPEEELVDLEGDEQ